MKSRTGSFSSNIAVVIFLLLVLFIRRRPCRSDFFFFRFGFRSVKPYSNLADATQDEEIWACLADDALLFFFFFYLQSCFLATYEQYGLYVECV